jgi:hypothetical protein
VRQAIAFAVLATLLGGCDGTYDYAVWNDTARAVIVETHHDTTGIARIEPGEHAQVAGSWGAQHRADFYMDVFSIDCESLGQVQLPTNRGTVAVTDDGLSYIDTTQGLPPGPDPPFINQHSPPTAEPCDGG